MSAVIAFLLVACGESAAPVSEPAGGGWITGESTNPSDNTTIAVASLEADTGRGFNGNLVTLVIRCSSIGGEFYIGWESDLGLGNISIVIRIGDGQPIASSWGISADNTVTFSRLDFSSFMRSLMEADRFEAQITPNNDNPIDAVFDLTGIEEAVPQVLEYCE